MIIATYCGNAEFFPKSKLVSLIGKYFGSGFCAEPSLKPSRRAASQLSSVCRKFGLPQVLGHAEKNAGLGALSRIIGKRYEIDAKGTSLSPIVLSGIQSISFRASGDTVTAFFEKREGRIPVPFAVDGSATYFTLSEGGETFSAAAMGKMTKNEDDVPVFKLSLYFLEMTSVRHIKIFFHHAKIIVRFSE